MEGYYCSNVVSAPLIPSDKYGGTSGKKHPLPSNSSDDIWADFDCAIDLGHQLRREDKLREMNRAYLTRGPISVEGFNDGDETKLRDFKGNPTGDDNTDVIISKLSTKRAEKEEEIPANPPLSLFSESKFKKKQGEEVKVSGNDKMQRDTAKYSHDHNVADRQEVGKTQTYTEPTADLQKDLLKSQKTSEKSFGPGVVPSEPNETVGGIGVNTLHGEHEDNSIKPKPSYLKLHSMIGLERQEEFISRDTSMNQLKAGQTDSRITVPVNTPVGSLTTLRGNFCGYSPTGTCSTELATNRDSSFKDITDMEEDFSDKECDEEKYHRVIPRPRAHEPADMNCVCPEPDKPSGFGITWFWPKTDSLAMPECNIPRMLGLGMDEWLSPRYVPQNSCESSSIDSEDDSFCEIKKLPERIETDLPTLATQRKSRVTETIDSREKQSFSYTDINVKNNVDSGMLCRCLSQEDNILVFDQARNSFNQPGLVSVERREDTLPDRSLYKRLERRCKPHRNVIIVKPIGDSDTDGSPSVENQSEDGTSVLSKLINEPDTDSSPREENQSGDETSVLSKSSSGNTDKNLQERSFRKRCRDALRKATRKIRFAIFMCTMCYR